MSVKEVYDAVLKPQTPGVYLNEPMPQYNTNRNIYLSSGYLKTFREESPKDYKFVIDQGRKDIESEALLEGRAHHVFTLEGKDKFDKEFILGGPINPNSGKEYGVDTKKFAAAQSEARAQGKDLITIEMAKRVVAVHKSCHSHKIISAAFKGGIAECTIRAKLHGVQCQVRLDYLSPTFGVLDLKTCESLARFERDARYKWGYLYSAAFYRDVLRARFPDLQPLPYSLVAVEKKGVYKCGIFNLEDDLLDHYSKLNKSNILELRECMDTGIWPTRFESLQTIELQ